ncbi:MAG TPA: crotonase/enoyl-CoA hydratase family protein [Ilumatobacteraceae bacterium]|jgi:enoyl-CoA hydratase|nr:crotonase/enoyl-CoA hydratase family protein [Ilumatobacteraceae bacterium]
MAVRVEDHGAVRVVTIDRPEVRNAVDGPTAQLLYDIFVDFDGDDAVAVAVLAGSNGTFCAGADLKAISDGRGNSVHDDPPDEVVGSLGPMGPTRLQLAKPVIAAVEGHAVAGGLELACWADLRVAASDATFGVFCRRWGVPLVDGGTVRLPRLIGQSRALDMILTGRGIDGVEAERIGLANRVVEPGHALAAALALAAEIAALPQTCLRSDRASSYDQWSLDLGAALSHETRLGRATIASGETLAGATRFAAGEGRHGQPA